MRSEAHSFQVSMDSPQAKNKPLKYFHSVFSPLPSTVDLRHSNNFKRKKTISESAYRVICTHVWADMRCEHHCTSLTSHAPVSSDITFVPLGQLSSSSPVEILGGWSHQLPVLGNQNLGGRSTLWEHWNWSCLRLTTYTQITITSIDSSDLLSTHFISVTALRTLNGWSHLIFTTSMMVFPFYRWVNWRWVISLRLYN